MIGSIIGDITGSIYEFNNYLEKDIEFLPDRAYFTDDTVMTVAIAKALLDDPKNPNAEYWMRKVGQPYPRCGYGGMFFQWMYLPTKKAYNSYGNGSAMRVSPVSWVAKDMDDCKSLSRLVTEVTHNHPEGIKGAEATAVAGYMARTGASKAEIVKELEKYYNLNFTIPQIKHSYIHNETCQETCPQAFVAFRDSDSFEDCIRLAVSCGGDSDTMAAIAGCVAGAYYGVPQEMEDRAKQFLTPHLELIVDDFLKEYPQKHC